MSVMETTLAEFDQESLTTKKLLDRVPEEWLSWRPHPRAYSLGQLALHIAEIPSGIAAAGSQDSIELPSLVQPEAKNRSEILAAFAKGLSDTKEKLAGMDDAAAFATWTAKKNGKVVMSVPRIAFVRAILLNHSCHHRGQLAVYLRLLDVPVPSIYGPSADENPFE